MAKMNLFIAIVLLMSILYWPADSRRQRGKKHKSGFHGLCHISLPQYAYAECKEMREKELKGSKVFYKLTDSNIILHPPHLDQPDDEVLQYFFIDKFHSQWSSLYFSLLAKSLREVTTTSILKYRSFPTPNYDIYFKIANDMKNTMMSAVRNVSYFKFPAQSYRHFTDISMNGRFQEDKYFVQLRLAGQNPMAIRRVVSKGRRIGTQFDDLLKRLNRKFDWNSAITSITKDKSILDSVKKNKVYVVEYPPLEGLKMMPDFIKNDRPTMKMKSHSSPIALFAVDPMKRLNVVAIQNISTQAGTVYTPKDGLLWNISRAQLQISDMFIGQISEHLLKTHFKMEPLCVTLHRHLSKMHPLHQILKYHCRGLLPVNKNGVKVLFRTDETLKSLFGYGAEGATQLVNEEFLKMTWNDTDLELNLKERGMDDEKQIPYYPYRDDGRRINCVLNNFAENLIDLYYRDDDCVKEDEELQNMMKELSTKAKGLPSKFETKDELATFVRQTLWIIVHHSALNYPIVEYSNTPAFNPTKIYEGMTSTSNHTFFDMLPGPISAVLQASLTTGLGMLHYDALFDYWIDLKSKKLSRLVREAYEDLRMVERAIDKENEKRFKRGQLTNPFMLPSWMPNSIST